MEILAVTRIYLVKEEMFDEFCKKFSGGSVSGLSLFDSHMEVWPFESSHGHNLEKHAENKITWEMTLRTTEN